MSRLRDVFAELLYQDVGADELSDLLASREWKVDAGLHLFGFVLKKFIVQVRTLGAPKRVEQWVPIALQGLPRTLRNLRKFGDKLERLVNKPDEFSERIMLFALQRQRGSATLVMQFASLRALGDVLVAAGPVGVIDGEDIQEYADFLLVGESRVEYLRLLRAGLDCADPVFQDPTAPEVQ